MIGWKKDSWFGYTMATIIAYCCFNGGVQKTWETNFWLGCDRNHAPCLTRKGGAMKLSTLKKCWFYLLVVLKLYKWNQNIFGSCDTRIYPFSNPKNLEKKTTHPQSPRPRSRTAYTLVSYDSDRQTWPRPYLWHPSGPSPCWKRNDQTADLDNACQCSPGRQTCWLCQWLHRVHLDRVPQGPSGPRERSAKLHLKNAMFGQCYFFLEFTNIDCFTKYPGCIISFPLQNECRNTC
jgi:hypothetical protein